MTTIRIEVSSKNPNTELSEKTILEVVDADLDEFAHWVEKEMGGPVQAPLHRSERAIIKTYLVRKLLPNLLSKS